MGAFGSGVQPSPRLTVDRCPRLNVNTLYATGGLTPGIETRLLWQLTPTSSPLTVLARAETSRLVLLVEGASESVMVQIVRQDRHRGGEQPFLTCPRCGVLRQHLYIRDREVGCRGKGCLSILTALGTPASGWWVVSRGCAVVSVLLLMCWQSCRRALVIGSVFIMRGSSPSLPMPSASFKRCLVLQSDH